MSASILSLHNDAWQIILSFLTTQDVAMLGAVGNPIVSGLLKRHVESANFFIPSGPIDIDACNRWALQYPKLRSVTVRGFFHKETAAKWPLDAKLFPRQLLSLDLCFKLCIDAFIQSVDMAAALPNLTSLSLSGYGPYSTFSKQLKLEAARFPPLLEQLSILGSYRSFLLTTGSIASLPRTLRDLTIHGMDSNENVIVYGDFPSQLTSLEFQGNAYLSYEALPHSLTKLNLINVYSRVMGKSDHIFPWRAYFPRLVDLKARVEDDELEAILDPAALDNPLFQQLKELISGDSGRSQAYADALRDPESGRIKIEKYKKLDIEFPYHGPTTLREDLIPQLSDLEICHIKGLPPALIEHLPKMTDLCTAEDGEDVLSAASKLPASLTSLTTASISDFAFLPVGLKTLDSVLSGATPEPLIFTPNSLTTLCLPSTSDEIINILPITITSLTTSFLTLPSKPKIDMRPDLASSLAPTDQDRLNPEEWMTPCDKAWRAIAARLVNLRKLVIQFSRGGPSMGLTPLKSTVFEEFSIRQQGTLTMIPWLSAVLDDLNTAGRPTIFPPSIRKMSLVFHQAETTPFVILAMLPRSLTSFVTNHMTIKNTLPNSPFPSNITPTEIMKQLPPNLREFEWKGTMTSYGDTIFVEQSVLPCLPRSLEIFFTNLFEFILDDGLDKDGAEHFNRVIELLPPNLSVFSYGPSNSYDHFYPERHGRLHHKLTFEM